MVSDILQERGIATSDTTNLPTAVGGFTDVKSNDYFTDAVLWAVEKNITSGSTVMARVQLVLAPKTGPATIPFSAAHRAAC